MLLSCMRRAVRGLKPLQVDDYSFAASSRATYMASMLCFAAVMGDACMVERAMQLSEVQGAAGRPAASMPVSIHISEPTRPY